MHQDLNFKANPGQMNVDEAQGIVECFVAAIGNKDSVGDIIVPGAFEASFRKRKPRVVWGHDWNSPIGKVLEIYEVRPGDPRMPEKMRRAGVGGVYARVQFNLKSERGREAFANVQFFGEEQEWSIGYKTLDAEWNGEVQANVLKELELYEVSPVLHGANQLTGTISIKQDKQKLKDPKGGLTAAGRRHYARTEGANLKPGVKGPADTPEKMRRKGSFLTRFFTNPSGPMKKPNGDPTRLALSAAAWGEPVPQNRSDAAELAAKGRRLLERYEKAKKKDDQWEESYDDDFDYFESFFDEEFAEIGAGDFKSASDEMVEEDDFEFKRAPSAADLDIVTDAIGLDVPQETVTGDVLRGYGPRRGNLERLLRYWRPIMRKPGGFRRCRVILADHPELYPLENLCAWLHHETTGLWPNEGCHHPGMKNCRRKARGVTRGSIWTDKEWENRLKKRFGKKKDAMWEEEYEDDGDEGYEEMIEKFAKALAEFARNEPDFVEYLSNADNWIHEGQGDDDEWMEHEWLIPMKPKKPGSCGCGCGGMKSDNAPARRSRPTRIVVKSADPFTLESDISPVLDNYGVRRSVSVKGIVIETEGVSSDGIEAIRNAAEAMGGKAIGRGIGRSARGYDPDAIDGDEDGMVQDGTAFERPAVANQAARAAMAAAKRKPKRKPGNLDSDQLKQSNQLSRKMDGMLKSFRRSPDDFSVYDGPLMEDITEGAVVRTAQGHGVVTRVDIDSDTGGIIEAFMLYTHDADGVQLPRSLRRIEEIPMSEEFLEGVSPSSEGIEKVLDGELLFVDSDSDLPDYIGDMEDILDRSPAIFGAGMPSGGPAFRTEGTPLRNEDRLAEASVIADAIGEFALEVGADDVDELIPDEYGPGNVVISDDGIGVLVGTDEDGFFVMFTHDWQGNRLQTPLVDSKGWGETENYGVVTRVDDVYDDLIQQVEEQVGDGKRFARDPSEKSASAPVSVHRRWAEQVVKQYGIPYTVKDGRVHYDTTGVTKSAKSDLYASLRQAKTEVKRDYSDATREQYAKRGWALPDGSYPIRDVGDLSNAIQAYGRAKDKPAAKKHIMKRARALGRFDMIPDNWKK